MNKEQMFELFLCTFDIGIILILNYKLIEQQFSFNNSNHSKYDNRGNCKYMVLY